MARRVNPIPKETPKYWRMPIVAVLQKKVYLYDRATGLGKQEEGKVGDRRVLIWSARAQELEFGAA